MALIDFEGFEHYNGSLPGGQVVLYGRNWGVDGAQRHGIEGSARTGTYVYTTWCEGNNLDGGMYRSLTASEEHATLVVGFAIRNVVFTYGATQPILILTSDGATKTPHFALTLQSDGSLKAKRGNWWDGTELGTSSTMTWTAGQWYYVEAKVTLSDTVGVVNVRVNGTTMLNLTSQDTKDDTGTKSVFDRVYLPRGNSGYGTVTMVVDDLYILNGSGAVRNDFLGPVKIYTVRPSGNGNSSQWTGSDGDSTDNFNRVSDGPYFEATQFNTYVQASTASLRDEYAVGDLAPATGTIHGVRVTANAWRTDTPAKSLKLGVRSGATSDFSASAAALDQITYAYSRVMEQNPIGPDDWTISTVNSVQIGIESA